MKYIISSTTAPQMPKLGKGLECMSLLVTQLSADMREPAIPMIFPSLGAHVSDTEFMYPDQTWKEPCGMLAHLVAETGMNKGQIGGCISAIMRKATEHDKAEMQKIIDYQKTVKKKGANKEKPEEPTVSIWFPPFDTTNPAFIKNAMALEAEGNRTMYFNMPEIEMADRLCGCHKNVSQTIRNIFDKQRGGALRATVDGVTGNPILRTNITFSSTPYAARNFYKHELYNGTLGRVAFSYKPRQGRSGKIPRQGRYEENFLDGLDVYLERLDQCKGRFIIPQLNKLADRLAADMATIADLADDDILWDMGKRAIVNAWKDGCILYIMNGQTWTRPMGELVEWLVYHDVWSKMQIFADMFKGGNACTDDAKKNGPTNMLDSLEDSFNEAQLEALRVSMDKPKEGTGRQLRVWVHRGFIEYSEQTGLYTKTKKYETRLKK